MKKKVRLILIVAVGLLAVTVFVFKGRTEMKHGRYHHWLVVHDLRRTGEYRGMKIREFIPGSDHREFQTIDGKVYTIWPDGIVRKTQWKTSTDPALQVVPKPISAPTNRSRDPNFVDG